MVVLVALLVVAGAAVGAFLNPVIDRCATPATVTTPDVDAAASNKVGSDDHRRTVRLRSLSPFDSSSDRPLRTSVRYGAVQLLTAGLFAVGALRLDHLHRLPALPAYLYLAAVGVALAFIDVAVHRLPDRIVLPSYPVLVILLIVASAVHHNWNALIRAGEGGAGLYLCYLVLALIYPAGMGFGDVKLAGILGGFLAYLSWSVLVLGGVMGFILAAFAGVLVVASRRGSLKTALPFGPFMLAGAAIAIFAGSEITSAYLRLVTRG